MTTTRKFLAVGLAAALAGSATACNNDDLIAVNNNPNSPTDAPSTALFTSAARTTVGNWLGNFNARGFELLAQHLAEVQYPETDQYTTARLGATATQGTFNNAYTAELQDLQLVIARGKAANDASLWGPATVLNAWTFFNLTDTFGDVPYSQAFKADSGILQPKYDPQAEIYADLFTKLAEASTAMGSATGSALGSSDPIYGGNVANWQRFSNSLRARQAMRLVNVDQAKASAELQAAFSAPGGVIETNAQNATLKWPGDGVYDNPWASNFQTRDDHRISNRMLGVMAPNADPRIAVYAMPAGRDTVEIAGKTMKYCPTPGTCYVALANALSQAEATPLVGYTSRPGAVFYPGATSYGNFGGSGRSFPSTLMTAAEVAFIKAEAAARGIGGFNAGQAAGFYAEGIRLSMEQWGITGAAVTAFLAQPGVVYVPGVEGQKQIAVQKWLALYSDGQQAWTEFRRTCQPAAIEPGPAATLSYIPRRLRYSTTESGVNAVNLAEAIDRMGGNGYNTRVYWDTNPTAAPTYEAGCGVRP